MENLKGKNMETKLYMFLTMTKLLDKFLDEIGQDIVVPVGGSWKTTDDFIGDELLDDKSAVEIVYENVDFGTIDNFFTNNLCGVSWQVLKDLEQRKDTKFWAL